MDFMFEIIDLFFGGGELCHGRFGMRTDAGDSNVGTAPIGVGTAPIG